MPPAFTDTTDFYRLAVSSKLDPTKRAQLGQYMTPAPIGRFMASLFDDVSGAVRVLDPGAGVGSLSAAFLERCAQETTKPRSAGLVCYEIEPALLAYLKSTLREAESRGRLA